MLLSVRVTALEAGSVIGSEVLKERRKARKVVEREGRLNVIVVFMRGLLDRN